MSTGLVGCSPVKTPGVKPVDASAEAPKGEEGEVDGVVINSSGAVYHSSVSATTQSVATLSPSDCERSVGEKGVVCSMAHRSLCSVMNDSTLDWDFASQDVEMGGVWVNLQNIVNQSHQMDKSLFIMRPLTPLTTPDIHAES